MDDREFNDNLDGPVEDELGALSNEGVDDDTDSLDEIVEDEEEGGETYDDVESDEM